MKNYFYLLIFGAVFLNSPKLTAQILIGHDEASSYDTETWVANSQAGTGFTSWILYLSQQDPNGVAGHLIGDAVADGFGDVNTDSKAFGMYGYKLDTSLSGLSEAVVYRYFNNTGAAIVPNTGGRTPLLAGQSFSIDLAVARRNGYKGLDLLTSQGSFLWNFGMDGDNRYQVNQTDIFENEYIQQSVFEIRAYQVTADTYKVTITRGEEIWASGIYSGTLGGFKIYEGSTTSSNVLNRIYFNNLKITNCAESTTWNGTAWSNGNPEITKSVIIEGDYTPQGNISACMLTVRNNASVIIPQGYTLTVANTVEVVEGASLTIEDNAALVQVNDVDNTGSITLHKTSNPLKRLDYTIWSSPVAGQNLAAFSPATSTNRFYEYRYGLNSSNNWVEGYWPVNPATTTFATAKGYLIRMPNSINTVTGYSTGTAATTFDGTFTGTPNNGDISISLSTANNRFTAVGNPYPSPISLDDFFAANSDKLYAATGLYMWRKRNDATSSSYVTITTAGYVANTAEPSTNFSGLGSFYTGNSSEWIVAAGQGFIVRTKADIENPVLTFTNSMRRSSAGASQAFFKSAGSTASKLWLNVTAPDTSAGQALVAYMDAATLGIDYSFDAMQLNDAAAVALYSIAENTPLAIQARPGFEAADVVPMGFTAPVAGQYTISLDHTEGVFSQGQAIYLKDKAEGLTRNMALNSYTFNSEAGTFEDRFEIVYQTTALGVDTPEAPTAVAYAKDKQVFINAGNGIATVTLYDITGRLIYSKDAKGSTAFSTGALDAAQQVVILKAVMANGITYSKKLILE